MSDARAEKSAAREILKRLRAERSEQIVAANAANAITRSERKKIVSALADGPTSVPRLAAAADLPSDRVLWHIAAMRKYGQIVETPEKEGGCYTYALVPEARPRRTARAKEAEGATEQTDQGDREG